MGILIVTHYKCIYQKYSLTFEMSGEYIFFWKSAQKANNDKSFKHWWIFAIWN